MKDFRYFFRKGFVTSFLLLILASAGFAQDSDSPLNPEIPYHFQSGAVFLVPKGWLVVSKPTYFLLQDPEKKMHLILSESSESDGRDAIQASWKTWDPDFSYPVIQSKEYSKDDKWDETYRQWYFVASDEDPTKLSDKRSLYAMAKKKGKYWYVGLLDFDRASVDKRQAQVNIIFGGIQTPDQAVSQVLKMLKGGSQPTSTPSAVSLDDKFFKDFEDFLRQAQDRCKIPGVAAAIVKDGKIVYEKGFGVKESGKGDKVTPKTLFAIASITKPLTSLMMARLVDQKKVTWDTPVAKLLSGFQLADSKMTQGLSLRYSLCACTGLPRQDMDLTFPAQEDTPEEMVEKMRTIAPTTGYGETFQYSNQMVAAGGYAAARVLQPDGSLAEAYAKALKTEVFDPLGMTDSCLSLPEVLQKDHATPHGPTLDLDYTPIPFSYEAWMDPILPAGGVWSNVEDMAQYVMLELSKGLGPDGTRLVSEKNLLKRREPQVRMAEDSFYGLGLIVENVRGVTVIGHGGSASGFSTEMCFLPDQGVGLVLLANARGAEMFTRMVRDRMVEMISGAKPQAQDALARWDVDRKDRIGSILRFFNFGAVQSWVYDYAGDYTNPELGKVSLRMDPEGAVFDEGKWKAPMGAYYDRNNEVRFILTKPPMTWLNFSLTDQDGKKTLTYRDAQKTYTFDKVGN